MIYLLLIVNNSKHTTRHFSVKYVRDNILKFTVKHGGSRSNYSFPPADLLVEQFKNRSELKGRLFEIDDVKPYPIFLSDLNKIKKKGKSIQRYKKFSGDQPWEKFLENINQNYLYQPDDPNIDDVIKNLISLPVVNMTSNPGSSHLVLKMTFSDGSESAFKIRRTPLDHEPDPNLYFYKEFERPQAEIAAYYLDRVLGFYRVPPTVHRVLNISRDIAQFAPKHVTETIHRSPVGNLCFYGKCMDYCSIHTPICGNPDLIEGSVSVFLSGVWIDELFTRWFRGFDTPPKQPRWAHDDTFCDTDVRTNENVTMRELLNYMDVAIFDFFTGNMDRHHVDTIMDFQKDTFFIYFDNGRGFGRSNYDCKSCIAPVRQCCLIRLSTLTKLIKLYIGPDSLSNLLRESLKADPSYPVLWEPHLDALDRRLGKILSVVSDCVNVKGKPWNEVVIDDGLN
ncbi:hypothetical protein Btru_068976 [Bulinus truncatus]|nr:hypothetical protein Btru_068976 [Bulinus truncatus]